MTKIELWMEGETSHLRVHTSASATYATVKRDLEALRDRLTTEIERGPTLCPHAPRNRMSLDKENENNLRTQRRQAGSEGRT